MESQTPRGHGRDTYSEPSTSTGKRKGSPNAGNEAKKQATERSQDTHRSKCPKQHRKNESRENRVLLHANYFRLKRKPTWTISRYHATFEPEVEAVRFRSALIAQHKPVIGNFLFDGTQVFAVRRLDLANDEIAFASKSREGQEYQVKLKFTGAISSDSREFSQILNLIQRRATKALNFQLVGRNFYDPNCKIDLKQFNMELWPGFDTSIRQYVGDLLLNCDVVHKVMRTDTVYTMLQETRRADANTWRDSFQRKVLGMTVLTGYNNKTYRIDDVDFTKSPMTTFSRKDEEITIEKYYTERYNITIRDKSQPLLITKAKERDLRGGEQRAAWLVPELCRVTGLSERQRTDISLKNAMKPYAQMNARVKKDRLLAYNRRIQDTPDSRAVFKEWELEVDSQLVQIQGIHLKPERLEFGGGRIIDVQNGGWDRECGRNMRLFKPEPLKRWYLLYPNQVEREAKKFQLRLIELARNMGFEISTPRPIACQHDRDMIGRIDELKKSNPAMMFFVITSPRQSAADIYSSIKKKCYGEESPIASQVATKFNLAKDKGYDSIVTKIAIQMCTKLGGAPWCPRIPMAGVMTIGFDISKDTKDGSVSFGCLVATMDLKQGVDFFSHVSSVKGSDKISTEFAMSVAQAVRHWKGKYNSLPRKLVVYRGGVGEGDLDYLENIEIASLKDSLAQMYSSSELELLYIVVTKKINTRIFEGDRNPQPGTVVDDVIKLAGRDEFYMISAASTQGTVAPSNYNILEDTSKLDIEKIQIWTWKQTHLYYNWCGTTRVPAVLQYATKLCFLVTNFMHKIPDSGQNDKLYFL